MTKRERAIIMAYTGGVTFTGDDIGYFFGYVKEKTGIELNVIDWSSDGVPVIYFGPNEEETVKKIRSACKEDFDNLIRNSNEEESSKDAEDSKDLFSKKVKALEQRCLKRTLRPDETLLLMLFDTTKVDKTDKDDENLIFNKKVTELEKRFGRELRPSEALLLVLFNSLEVVKADDKKEDVKCDEKEDMSKAGNWLLTLVLLAATLGIDPESGSKKESEWTKVKEFRKHMDECCCAKKEDEK